MCFGTNSKPPLPALSAANLTAPPMSALVGETFEGRQVKCVDMTCNLFVTVIAVAMLVFAVIMLISTISNHGWHLKTLPVYGTLGFVAVAGISFSILSIKWIVEGCQKWSQFNDVVNDLTT